MKPPYIPPAIFVPVNKLILAVQNPIRMAPPILDRLLPWDKTKRRMRSDVETVSKEEGSARFERRAKGWFTTIYLVFLYLSEVSHPSLARVRPDKDSL